MIFHLLAALGAFLLFFIQPFIGKAITPWFGGSSHVWITCMVFFQALLLGGYAYAHGLVTCCRPRMQAIVHSLLLLTAVGAMLWTWRTSGRPMLPPLAWAPTPGGASTQLPTLWLLTRTVGLPFFALSATAPLVQAWFASLNPGKPPFRLYAFSNAGSFAGLLAYPFLAESFLPKEWQALLIFAGFVAFSVLMSGTALRLPEAPARHGTEPEGRAPESPWFLWLLASAVGSIMLLSATNLLSETIANIPLLWVLPLAVYLCTFILWFDSRWLKEGRGSLAALAAAFVLALVLLEWALRQPAPSWIILAVCLVVGAGCLLAHGFLYALRPSNQRLTAYYLAMSAGGLVGGMLVGIGAPRCFDRVYEFPLAISLCGLLALLWSLRGRWPGQGWLLACGFLPLFMGFFGVWRELHRPGRFYRDDYGVVNVLQGDNLKILMHGQILHGLQRVDQPLVPLAFYGPTSGAGQAFAIAQTRKPKVRVGVVGLGLGSVAGYGRPGDVFRFYEISPLIIELSTRPRPVFDVIRSTPATVEMIPGDGRLSLERELALGPQGFDLILIDAFTSGQVPWHLITREAFRTYLGHLAPGDLLAIHVSNRLPIDRLVAATAKDLGLWAMAIDKPGPNNPIELDPLERMSNYVLLAPDDALAVNELVRLSTWIHVPKGDPVKLGPISMAKARHGESIASSMQPWSDSSNSLASLLWAGRPAFLDKP